MMIHLLQAKGVANLHGRLKRRGLFELVEAGDPVRKKSEGRDPHRPTENLRFFHAFEQRTHFTAVSNIHHCEFLARTTRILRISLVPYILECRLLHKRTQNERKLFWLFKPTPTLFGLLYVYLLG
ncbi:unnamed protein product [Laminaria digitata]